MYPPPLTPEEEAQLLANVAGEGTYYTPTDGGRDMYSLQPGEHYVAPVANEDVLLLQMQTGLENRQIPLKGLFGGGDRHYPPAQ
jgi:hypothetical protein